MVQLFFMAHLIPIKGSKRLLNAWAFYDWANSVYSLVIASAIFPIYYGALFRMADIEKVSVFWRRDRPCTAHQLCDFSSFCLYCPYYATYLRDR